MEKFMSKTSKKKVTKKKVTKKKVTKKVVAKKPVEVVETVSAGDAWWNQFGADLVRRGVGQRNIILRAARASGKSFNDAMKVLRGKDSVEIKAKSLF